MLVTRLEQLPDEILLEVCLYLKPYDVINSFGQLNHRLEQTISQYRRDADLHHLTLKQFQRWHKHLLHYTSKSVVNLVVSNWNSPGQIYLFNQLMKPYASLYSLFSNIKQVRLIDFTNNDIDILSKLDKIEKLFIDADALVPLSYSTHTLLDKYLFCSSSHFKEIRLWGVEGGIRSQHHVPIVTNFHLERLTISVALLDDLILMFRRSPNLRSLNVEIAQHTTKALRQNATVDMLPKRLTFFHFQTTDQCVLSSEDLDKLVSNIPSIELLSLDMDTNDFDYASACHWTNMLSCLTKLKHVYFKLRIWLKSDLVPFDTESIIHAFQQTNLPICCYVDTKVLHIDTVPYNMKQFDTNMSVTTSPKAMIAKTTSSQLFNQPSKRVQTLIIDGQHDPTHINEWLSVITRFPGIEILQLNSVNIQDKETSAIDLKHQPFQLPHMGYLHYIRSTSCRVHVPFFLLLANNTTISPQLKALSMMYGDLVYLCKRLPGCTFERIKELWLYGGEADGHVILRDIDLILKTFPCLSHFYFNNQSSRFLNRHLQLIIETILRSSPDLISFRISCNKSSLRFLSSMDIETCTSWIQQVCGLCEHERIHVTVNDKLLSIWK
ncbi:unnamed protein product [Adineta ricciae]|uniref:F-box domain-containing protein n=1 Tax=Adineta ricciae TaxID=249248 RepID=A0A813WL75_ADIRI|nr:unnamed protein product [Adineta ricciae]